MVGFGTKIRKAREDLGLKQSDVAALIPMNQSNYSKIERDAQQPNLEQLRKICKILKIDSNYLLGLEEYEGFYNEINEKDFELLKDVKRLINKYKK